MSDWKQPNPTKEYAIYLDGAWYGEGDTVQAAWNDARRQVQAGHSSYSNAMWNKLRHGAVARRITKES